MNKAGRGWLSLNEDTLTPGQADLVHSGVSRRGDRRIC